MPIATSTPVNLAAGPLSPPPLTLAAGQAPHRDEHPPGAPTVKVTSYPAVLKGRSAASPPNPNLVPSGKVPPPVPPRGTGSSRIARSSEEHRAAGAAASTTSSSVTSSRGDEAAIIITRYRLHERSSTNNPHHHHHLLPHTTSSSCDRSASTTTSTTTADDATRYYYTVATTSSNKATATTTTASTTTSTAVAVTSALHALRHRPTRTPDTYRAVTATSHRDVVGSGRLTEPEWRGRQELYEDDEFVSVEKVEDAYFIKTSPYPFRPDRGVYRSDRLKGREEAGNRAVSRRDKGGRAKTDPLLFLGPSVDFTTYRMSRKDKKHSETYYERMKRKQKDLETSITTITTTMSYGRRSSTDGAKSAEKQTKRRISRFAATTKDSLLLRKIRDKSRRKKRLAPEPSARKRSSEALTSSSEEARQTKENGKKPPSQMAPESEKNPQGERQSAIKRERTSSRQSRPVESNNYVDEKENVPKGNVDQGSKRGGFRGIFPKSHRVEGKSEKIFRDRIGKFNWQTDGKLEKRHRSNEQTKVKEARGDKPKEKNSYEPPIASGKEVFASLDNVRISGAKSFVSEQVKSFESFRTNVGDEAKESRRDDTRRPCNSEHVVAVKRKLAPESTREEAKLRSRMKTSSVGPRSFSNSHCNDLPRELGSLVPNVSFLHTYRKTRSFT